MITSASMTGVALIALAMVLTPGPNMIYLVSRSISQGRRAGLISLGGVATGFLVYLAATCAGLTAVLFAVPTVFTAVKMGGALYLAYLAWSTLRPGGKSAFEVGAVDREEERQEAYREIAVPVPQLEQHDGNQHGVDQHRAGDGDSISGCQVR